MKRILRKTLCVVLALIMTFGSAFAVFAEGQDQYISEVKIEHASTAEAAKAKLEAAGYTVYDQNLNDTNGGDYSYIGYKTTRNPDEGITKISAMNMNGGFENMTYRDVIQSQMDGITNTAKQIKSAAEEFGRRYNAGYNNSKLAMTILNTFDVDGTALGTYLIDKRRSDSDFVDLVLICDSTILSAIYTQLSIGVAPDTANGSKSWMQELSENGPIDFSYLAEEDGTILPSELEAEYKEHYDGKNLQAAKDLWPSINVFVTDYKEALARHPGGSFTLEEAGLAVDGSKTRESAKSQAMDDAEKDRNGEVEEGTEDYRYLALYNALNQKNEDGSYVYPFGKNADGSDRSIAQYIYQIGSANDKDSAALLNAYREMYPLLAVLNDAQETMMRFSGFYVYTQANTYTKDVIDETYSELQATVKDMKAEGLSSISVWTGVNKDIYNQSVGVTSKAKRAATASNNYDILTKAQPDQIYKYSITERAYLYAALIGGIALAVLGVALICAVVAGLIIGCGFGALGITTMISVIVLCGFGAGAATVAAVGVAATILAVTAAILVVLVAIAVIVALVFLFIWIFSRNKGDEPPKEAEIVYTPIPNSMYDLIDEKQPCAIYSVVTDIAGNPQDVNCWQHKQWVALYTSHDKRYGGPIVVPGNNPAAVFKVQWTTYSQAEGYSPLAFFGEKQAANLNFASKKADSNSLYFSYNKGAKVEDIDTTTQMGKYIMDVTMKCETSEEAAKLAVKNAGYTLVDYNLTPNAKNKVKRYVNKDTYYYESLYTYIGYTTTDNPAQAVTDLRVSISTGQDGKGGQQSWGVASYGSCGYIGDLILWETKSAYAGTPILADGFHIITDINARQDGWEGINLFSGGYAYDFDSNGNCKFDGGEGGIEYSKDNKWYQHVYVFFVPETQYKSTDPGATKYIGGLAFFNSNNRANEDMSLEGWTLVPGSSSLTDHLGGDQNQQTVLCCSYTYNPYRAISDIKAYEAEPDGQQAQYTFSSAGTSYVAVDVFQRSGDSYKFIRSTHAYVSNNYYESGTYFTTQDKTDNSDEENPKFNLQDFAWYKIVDDEDSPYNISFQGEHYLKSFFRDRFPMAFYNYNGLTVMSAFREKYLYVTGCGYTLNPIRADELTARGTKTYDKSYTPVRSIKNWYSLEAENLCFNDIDNNGQFYLYIKRPITERPKYVAAITVKYNNGTYTDKDGKSQAYPNPYDATVMALQSNGPGELIEVNLANNPADHWAYSVAGQETYFKHVWQNDMHGGYWSYEKADKDYRRFLTQYDKHVAYMWVTYTDVAMKSICDMVIVPVSSSKPTNYVNDSEDTRYTLAGDAFRFKNESQYYALYTSVAGDPMTDIQVSTEPMSAGWYTVLGLDNVLTGYQQHFIQYKTQSSSAKSFVTNFVVGSGSNTRDALLNLLSKGCKTFVPFNVSPSDNSAAYLGVSVSGSYKKAFTGIILEDTGQDTSIVSVSYKRYVWDRISENLNDDTYDACIYLFGTKDSKLAKKGISSTKAKDWRYISDIGFFTGTDLNDYVDGKKDIASLPSSIRPYVQSLLTNGDGTAKHWDIITDENDTIINVNRGAYVVSGVPNDVYMYVHYTDDSYRDPSLLGSIFGSTEALLMVIVVTVILIAAAVWLTVKKKKANI